MEQNTALLVMDMQTAIIRNLSDSKIFVDNVSKAVTNARNRKIPVIYIVVGFRQGMPEININSAKSFALMKEKMTNANMDEWMKIEDAVTPLANEIIITKRRISAFTGSDLEVVLRASNIRHLVLTGIATSGVVLSTVREAADKDFRLTVLNDACADADKEVHCVLTEKIFPRQADVITTEEWLRPEKY